MPNHHDKYPLRRYALIVGAAASLATAGCASAEAPPAHDVHAATSVPAFHRHTGHAALGETVRTQRDTFIAGAMKSAKAIVSDAANQASLCTPESQLEVGNESALDANGKIGTMFPNISLSFDPDTRTISLSSVQRLNPSSTLLHAQLSSLTLTFNVSTAAIDKYLGGKQLEATNFALVMNDTANLTLNSIDLVSPTGTETKLNSTPGADYFSVGPFGGNQPQTQTTMSPNASIYTTLSTGLESFDRALAQAPAPLSN